MDVVALAQSGIDYAVATLGTAATEAHVQRLFRAVDDIVFCFDGDEAGRRAAWRAVENTLPAMKAGRQALFLFLPEGEDPDSLGSGGRPACIREPYRRRRSLEPVPVRSPCRRSRSDHARRTRTARRFLPPPSRNQGPARAVSAPTPDAACRVVGRSASAIAHDRSTARRPVHPARHQASESPVRRAIRMLLHEPSLATHAGAVEEMRGSDVAGADLLADLVETLHARPDMTTGVLLEHFREHEWSRWLEVLAHSEPEISDPEGLREEFVGLPAAGPGARRAPPGATPPRGIDETAPVRAERRRAARVHRSGRSPLPGPEASTPARRLDRGYDGEFRVN